MSDRYSADVPAMTAAAGRLDAAAAELRAAGAVLDGGAGAELGPAGLTAAVDALADAWSGRLRVTEADLDTVATDLGAARDAYLDAEQTAAAELNRGLDTATTGDLYGGPHLSAAHSGDVGGPYGGASHGDVVGPPAGGTPHSGDGGSYESDRRGAIGGLRGGG